MTKRELLMRLGPAPLDAEILDENGKKIRTVLFEEPEPFREIKRIMLTSRDIGHVEVRKEQPAITENFV